MAIQESIFLLTTTSSAGWPIIHFLINDQRRREADKLALHSQGQELSMEARGRERSRSISSSSGTTTAYTSGSSRLSWISMEALHLEAEMERKDADFVEPAAKKSRKETADEKKIKNLAKEFFGAPSGSIDMSVLLERWFKEMSVVGWVQRDQGITVEALKWIKALQQIVGTLSLVDEEEASATTEREEREARSASFTQQAMLKLLSFVDVLVLDASNPAHGVSSINQVPAQLQSLLYVREALSNAVGSITSFFLKFSSSAARRILGELESVVSAKDGAVVEAIWTEFDKTKNRNRLTRTVNTTHPPLRKRPQGPS